MNMHKMAMGLTLVFAFALIGWTQSESTQYTITSDSEMRVEGTSSLHDWTAEVKSLTGMLEVSGGNGLLEGGTISTASMIIAVSDLDADNGTMNKKMREALKAKSHSTIRFDLDSAEMVGAPEGNAFQILARGNLELAGVKKVVEITLNGHDLGGGTLRLRGDFPLVMSDYDIKPPTAMLGTIKTGDEVVIHFDLLASKAADA